MNTKRTRQVIVTANTLLEILKNYCGAGDVPEDSKLSQMLLHPSDRKLKFVVESDQIKSGQPPLLVHFALKRIYTLGESNG